MSQVRISNSHSPPHSRHTGKQQALAFRIPSAPTTREDDRKNLTLQRGTGTSDRPFFAVLFSVYLRLYVRWISLTGNGWRAWRVLRTRRRRWDLVRLLIHSASCGQFWSGSGDTIALARAGTGRHTCPRVYCIHILYLIRPFAEGDCHI